MINYENSLSKTVQQIKPSGIRRFFDLLENMEDVTALTVGQPDFVTPWHIREAAIDTLEQGKTHYTSNAGLKNLREAISEYSKRRFDLKYSPDEVIVTVGGSEAIDLAMRALIDPGDEVIIPIPSFVCYGPIASLAGGVPVYIDLEEKDSFKLTPEKLKAAITPRTKLLVLPFPNNPTGSIMTKDELEGIAGILEDTDIFVLSDEIYAELTYGSKHCSIASLDGMRERTIVASGFSKAYAMTGWRLGYTLAPQEITKQMLKIHQYAIMCSPTASQYAGIEAMINGDEDVKMMRDEYDRRRLYIINGLKKAGINCYEPRGAFYVFPYIGKFGLSSEEFCSRLLYESKVAIVPGTAFGDCGEGYARISYAYSVKHISTALEKISEFTKKLSDQNT